MSDFDALAAELKASTGIVITLDNVLACFDNVRVILRTLTTEDFDGEAPFTDVRLGVDPRTDHWKFSSGDPQYQQDWRGAWASSILSLEDSKEDRIQIARDLLDEVLEVLSQLPQGITCEGT